MSVLTTVPNKYKYYKNNELKISHIVNDNRPYLDISILGHQIKGLLDSGATCTVLGKGGVEFLKKLNLEIQPVDYLMVTAADHKMKVFGTVDLPYTYHGITHIVKTVISPSVTKPLILGYDFFEIFKIKLEFLCEFFSNDSILNTIEYDLNESEKELFLEIVRKFPPAQDGRLGKTHLVEHTIETGIATPIKQKHHIWSPFVQEKVMSEVRRMIQLGVIEPASSSWNNPLVVVPKSNGKLRICLDSRALNKVTIRDSYPLPQINRILSRIRCSKYISSIDLKDAYWQIGLSEASKSKTAFTIPGVGFFMFSRLPFGLSNSAQVLCKLMDKILGVDLEPFVFVYLDDIIILSDSLEEHFNLLSIVADRLKKAGLTINIQKSKFLQKQVEYLGYIISENGLQVNPERLAPILNYSTPTCIKDIRRFMGMATWYSRFIPGFSDLAAPITDLNKKNKKFAWTKEADEAFRKIKTAIVEAVTLANPDFTKPFYIHTDASDFAIAGVLVQFDSENKERAISHFSRKLTSSEKKFATTEKEALAVLDSLKKFRGYIEGTHVTVVTDHSSLTWLQNLKDPTGRLGRWALKMQQYDLTIQHRPGKLHTLPDAFSRAISELSLGEDFQTDRWYSDLCVQVEKYPQDYPSFRIMNEILYKYCHYKNDLGDIAFKWKQVVPTHLRKDILLKVHDIPRAGHMGFFKTFEKIKSNYYWPGMLRDVKNHVSMCEKCKTSKYPTKKFHAPMGAPKVATRPWEIISIDFVGDFVRSKRGNKAILVITDWFSKFVILHPVRRQDAKLVVPFVENNIFCKFGVPAKLVSDNGTQFKSRVFTDLLKQYGVTLWLNARYHAQNNPTERVNRVLLASMRAYLKDDQSDWDLYLQQIACAMNTSCHESTKYSPYKINFGREMIMFGNEHETETDLRNILGPENVKTADALYEEKVILFKDLDKIVKENIQLAYNRYSRYYNLRSKTPTYKVGDVVYKKNYALSSAIKGISAKLTPRNIKCKIVKQTGSNTYELEDAVTGKSLGIYHAKDLS